MAASSRGFTATPFTSLELKRLNISPRYRRGLELPKKRRICLDGDRDWPNRITCCCPDSVVPIRRPTGSGKSVDKAEDWRLDTKKNPHRVRIQALPAMPFASPQYLSLHCFVVCWDFVIITKYTLFDVLGCF